MTSPIYHPASNGQAENAVRICKKMIKCSIGDNLPQKIISERLLDYLFVYRNTEHCSTGEPPAKLMFGRNLRSRLDLILPNEDKSCVNKQPVSKRKFNEGDVVWVRWYSSRKGVWKKGIVKEILGNRMYSVYIIDYNEVCVRHIDQLFKSVASRDLDVSQPSSSPGSSVIANRSAQYQSVSMPLALPSPTVHTEAPVPSAVAADPPVEQIVEEEGLVECCERGILDPNTSDHPDPPLTPPLQTDRPLTPTSPPRMCLRPRNKNVSYKF